MAGKKAENFRMSIPSVLDEITKVEAMAEKAADKMKFSEEEKESLASDPLSPENLLKESGRGLFIVSSLMDDFQYHFHKDGTEINLIKEKKS